MAPRSGSPGELLEVIRAGAAGTRTELVDVTGLSRSTVMQRLGALLAAGLVIEGPEAAPSSGGRRPAALRFNERAGVVLAADLGAPTAAWRCATWPASRWPSARSRSASPTVPRPCWRGSARRSPRCWTRPAARARTCWPPASASRARSTSATGRPVSPTMMPGWDAYPVADDLAARFGAPVLVDRDVNAMALGEHRRNLRSVAHLVFVKIATGIGAGIVADGELLRGHLGRAGDIGHIRAITPSDALCTCGNRGCVGAVASGRAIIRQLAEAGVEVASTASWSPSSSAATPRRPTTCARPGACWGPRWPGSSASSRRGSSSWAASWRRPPSRCWPASASRSTGARRRWPRASCGS